MTLALTSPTHPTGFSPVCSSNSAIFVEFVDEGVSEPAAYSPCEGSCELQNARAEMIPALGFVISSHFLLCHASQIHRQVIHL